MQASNNRLATTASRSLWQRALSQTRLNKVLGWGSVAGLLSIASCGGGGDVSLASLATPTVTSTAAPTATNTATPTYTSPARPTPPGDPNYANPGSLKRIVENTERAVLQSMLKKYGESLEAKKMIAGQLGISLATLYNKTKYLIEDARNN